MIAHDEPIDMTALITRRVAWDFSPCEKSLEICDWLGLVPATEEVIDKEHADSHARLNKCKPLVPHVEVCTRIMAEIVKKLAEKEGHMPEHMLDEVGNQFHDMCGSAIYTALAQLFDIGMITYGRGLQ